MAKSDRAQSSSGWELYAAVMGGCATDVGAGIGGYQLGLTNAGAETRRVQGDLDEVLSGQNRLGDQLNEAELLREEADDARTNAVNKATTLETEHWTDTLAPEFGGRVGLFDLHIESPPELEPFTQCRRQTNAP